MTTLPTPYYASEDGKIVLYHGLQQDLLPLLTPGLVDAVITDSPYGTTALEWDIPVDWPAFWPAVYRVCKPSAVQVLFSQQPFTTDLINSNRANYRYELIWPKTIATDFLRANKRPLKAHESIQFFAVAPDQTTYNPQKTKGHAPYRFAHKRPMAHVGEFNSAAQLRASDGDRFPTTILPQFSNGNNHSEHETQKPLDLMMWLVATYTNPGDLVLDPFIGSGSTAEACKKLGRRCIGIETREQPLQVAVRRLMQDVMEVAA